jgi:hypothetical protein
MEDKKQITGKDIIALGFKPAKWFPVAIDYINTNHLLDMYQKTKSKARIKTYL